MFPSITPLFVIDTFTLSVKFSNLLATIDVFSPPCKIKGLNKFLSVNPESLTSDENILKLAPLFA